MLILLTIALIFGIQATSHGFFGGIGGAIADAAGAVGDAIGAVGDAVGIIVDVAADVVSIAADVLGLSIRVVATVFWDTDSLFTIATATPDGGIIGVVVSNLIHLWDPLTGQTAFTLTHDATLRSITFSEDGLLLASASDDNTIQLWNLQSQTLEGTLRGHTDSVLSVAFSPDGLLLVSASTDNTVRLWNPQLQTSEGTLRGHTDSVLSVAFSPDGLLLASASADNTVRLWNPQLQTPEGMLRGHTDSVLSVAFSPDGLLLVSASADNTVRLWNPQTAQQTASFNHKTPVLSIAFSPEGEILATGGEDGTARLWNLHPDPNVAKVAATLGHESPVRSVAFSPEGDILYSGSADGKMRQWEITIETETGKIEVVDPSTDEGTPLSVRPGDNDTSLVVQFTDFKLGFLGEFGYAFQWRQKESQGNWREACIMLDEAAVTINNLTPNTTYEVRYTDVGPDCFIFDLSPPDDDDWSPIAEGTTSGAPDTSTEKSEPISPTTDAVVSISPASVASPAVGEQLEFSLNITGGEAVAGYQASVQFDDTALRYVSGANGDFLPTGAFFVQPKIEGNLVQFNAASLAGESNGDGTLAILTFEIIAVKTSTLTLSDALLSNKAGESSHPQVESAQITEPTQLKGDVNGDGIVNIQDLVLTASNLGKTGQNSADVNGDGFVNIQDLVLVAGALGNTAAAPSLLYPNALEMLTAADIQLWLSQAQQLRVTDMTSQRGILFLEQLLAALIPKETSLLANYPNPFNPETWIPYQLAKDADVTLTIYAVDGQMIRWLALGHQPAGMYQNRSRAAYWDGRNAFGEPVASGVYFYTLTAGDFTATRKMLIRK